MAFINIYITKSKLQAAMTYSICISIQYIIIYQPLSSGSSVLRVYVLKINMLKIYFALDILKGVFISRTVPLSSADLYEEHNQCTQGHSFCSETFVQLCTDSQTEYLSFAILYWHAQNNIFIYLFIFVFLNSWHFLAFLLGIKKVFF